MSYEHKKKEVWKYDMNVMNRLQQDDSESHLQSGTLSTAVTVSAAAAPGQEADRDLRAGRRRGRTWGSARVRGSGLSPAGTLSMPEWPAQFVPSSPLPTCRGRSLTASTQLYTVNHWAPSDFYSRCD